MLLKRALGSYNTCNPFGPLQGSTIFWFSRSPGRLLISYPGADKSLARPGRKQASKHVRDARDFNNIETWAVIKFLFFLQGKAPKEFHAILTETVAFFRSGRAKDLSAPL